MNRYFFLSEHGTSRADVGRSTEHACGVGDGIRKIWFLHAIGIVSTWGPQWFSVMILSFWTILRCWQTWMARFAVCSIFQASTQMKMVLAVQSFLGHSALLHSRKRCKRKVRLLNIVLSRRTLLYSKLEKIFLIYNLKHITSKTYFWWTELVWILQIRIVNLFPRSFFWRSRASKLFWSFDPHIFGFNREIPIESLIERCVIRNARRPKLNHMKY